MVKNDNILKGASGISAMPWENKTLIYAVSDSSTIFFTTPTTQTPSTGG